MPDVQIPSHLSPRVYIGSGEPGWMKKDALEVIEFLRANHCAILGYETFRLESAGVRVLDFYSSPNWGGSWAEYVEKTAAEVSERIRATPSDDDVVFLVSWAEKGEQFGEIVGGPSPAAVPEEKAPAIQEAGNTLTEEAESALESHGNPIGGGAPSISPELKAAVEKAFDNPSLRENISDEDREAAAQFYETWVRRTGGRYTDAAG